MHRPRAFAHLRASAALHGKKVSSTYLRYACGTFLPVSLYLLLIFAKAPFSIAISSGFFSLYGGLLHFVYYYFTETKCSTALSACIFLSFLFNSRSASPLVEDCFCLFSIRQKGYRFNRCPKKPLYIHVLTLLHTAVTGYGGGSIKDTTTYY